MPETQTVPLYRIENPEIPAQPDEIVSHEALVGKWFTPNLDSTLAYLRKSTQTFGKDAHPVNGARLVVAHVPKEELEALHVSQNHLAAGMDVENDNYIIPRDGSVDTVIVDLDDSLEDLKGRLARIDYLLEAKRRIIDKLAEVATTA